MSGLAIELARGLGLTLALTACAAAVALAAALAAGLARSAKPHAVRWAAAAYVEVFRGTSALVQLFWVYFVLPFAGIELGAFTAGVVVLGLNAGAYGAEVVRGAINAVPAGQRDAAAALNLSSAQTLVRVVLPQALPGMIAPAGNLAIELLKNTALVSMIAVHELTFTAQLLRASTLQTGIIFAVVLALYFAAASVIARAFRRLERHAAVTA
ncbi:MAG TPA: ectoine/hydroxyectoine ABC transporter permease subunit EhuC [Burkholderiales bacterium]|nr:ectoine/hydroxyectoine ABC transporter permease subunit EhuC [Burkholderiales bacterium]